MLEVAKFWKLSRSSTGVESYEIATDRDQLLVWGHAIPSEEVNYCYYYGEEGERQIVCLYKTENFLVLKVTAQANEQQTVPLAQVLNGFQRFFGMAPTATQVSQFVAGLPGKALKTHSIEDLAHQFERVETDHRFLSKMGILLQKSGQKTEEEMFNNENGSLFYDQFLQSIGQRVELLNFEGYNGGLDLKGRESKQSIYVKKSGHELMFHVGTLMRQQADDPQQVGKKKHIGNDNVVVVFQEEVGSILKSDFMRSNMIYALVVVQNQATEMAETLHYKINVVLKSLVEEGDFQMSQKLIDGCIFQQEEFADIFFRLLLNVKEACWRSGDLVAKLTRLKQMKINEWVRVQPK